MKNTSMLSTNTCIYYRSKKYAIGQILNVLNLSWLISWCLHTLNAYNRKDSNVNI